MQPTQAGDFIRTWVWGVLIIILLSLEVEICFIPGRFCQAAASGLADLSSIDLTERRERPRQLTFLQKTDWRNIIGKMHWH